MDEQLVASPLASLLSAHAGADASRHRMLWALDERFGQIAATTSEPMIGRIKLAWWQEALTDEAGLKGRGEPLVDRMRGAAMLPPKGLAAWIDGWEALIEGADLADFARGRGGGLFHALSGQEDIPQWLGDAGAVWALWDLSSHSHNEGRANEAVEVARGMMLRPAPRWPSAWRPMRIAYQLAEYDIRRGRSAPKNLTPGLYLRLIRIALTGR